VNGLILSANTISTEDISMPAKMKLLHIDLLHLLETPDFSGIASGLKEKFYPKKSLVCSPYDQKDSVFIVKTGRLRIFLSNEEREFTLALLEPGDIFSTHTRAFAEALEDSTILVGRTPLFSQQLTKSPEVAMVMVKVLGDLLKNSITIIEDLAFKNTRQRFFDFLLNAAQDRGRSHPEGIEIELGLSTEELALLVGTTRQTISTSVNELIKAKVVKRSGRQSLIILDLAFLTKSVQ